MFGDWLYNQPLAFYFEILLYLYSTVCLWDGLPRQYNFAHAFEKVSEIREGFTDFTPCGPCPCLQPPNMPPCFGFMLRGVEVAVIICQSQAGFTRCLREWAAPYKKC